MHKLTCFIQLFKKSLEDCWRKEGGWIDLKKRKIIVNCKRKAYWKGKRKLCAFSKGDCGWKGGKKKKKKKSSPILEDREVEKINKCSSFQEEKEDGGNGKKKCSSIL